VPRRRAVLYPQPRYLWQMVGTLGDYTWNPGAYEPWQSMDTWSAILAASPPCDGS
jgi:hypothetical protein